MIEQYNKPSTESMQSFVGEIKQLCQVSSNMQTLNLSLVQKWFLTEQRKENLHHHEHKEQQVKVTFSIRQYVLIRRIIIFFTNYVFSTGYAQLRTTIHGGYFFTHGLHELQNCTSVWADTCFSAKVASSDEASGTRNNRPCR